MIARLRALLERWEKAVTMNREKGDKLHAEHEPFSYSQAQEHIATAATFGQCANELRAALAAVSPVEDRPAVPPLDEYAEGTRRWLAGEGYTVSTGIAADELTYGYGRLDANGYWEFPVHPRIAELLDAKFAAAPARAGVVPTRTCCCCQAHGGYCLQCPTHGKQPPVHEGETAR